MNQARRKVDSADWLSDPVLGSAIEYEHKVRSRQGQHNPIIVIPGILGSNITDPKTNKPVWGEFGSSFTNARGDEYLRLIALPMEQGKTLDQLRGTATSDGSMRYIKGNFAGLPITINAYASMMSAMGVGGLGIGGELKKLDDYIDDRRHEANAFEFDYDWRRSIDENAVRLGNYIKLVTRFLQLKQGNYEPIKFDIVAHSMGALVTRYYLQYGSQLLPAGDRLPIVNWSGSAQVERAIFLGPPNGGSLYALERLLVGMPKNPLTPHYDPVVLGTLPSVYQLLPRLRHRTFLRKDTDDKGGDYYSTRFWEEMNWGLANTNKATMLARLLPGIDCASERRDTALDHMEKCLNTAKKLHQTLDHVPSHPEHLQLYLFVGDATLTPLVAT